MTDDPRRRHLTPEEAAELRRRARERRGYADPGAAPRRAAGPRDAAQGRGRAGGAGYQPRQQPEPLPPDERARLRRRLGQSEEPPRAAPRSRPAGRDPRRAPVDPRRDARGASAPPVRARRPARDRRGPRRRGVGPVRILVLVLALVLTRGVVSMLWADSKLQRIDALPDYPGRGGDTPGTVSLLVGTDSRDGMTAEQQEQLATGSTSDAGGQRTDTMMLVYTPRGGGDTMIISLPRDLLVDVPGYGQNKLNAAYSLGGPALLTQTLEQQTGMRIDHYAEIGFGGFAGIVDAVGGVDICIDEPIQDPMAGLDLAAGCQTLAGPQALGFVRSRYGFAEQDLQRVRNQRQFLGALMKKVMSPGNLLNPFTATSLIDAGSEAVTVDTDDHVWDLGLMMWRLKGDPLTV